MADRERTLPEGFSGLKNLQAAPELAAIAEKIRAGQRLDSSDGLALFSCPNLHALGALADEVCRKRHGGKVYYNVNRHINYTNVCALRCKFCAFRRGVGEEGAYELTIERMAEIAAEAACGGATELHVTGGLHPSWPLDHYRRMVTALRSAAPKAHIKAFTAVEIAHFARLSRVSVEEVLLSLMEAGLNSLPGGGAEIFAPSVRQEAFPSKISEEDWFGVHRTAHKLGLPTNATILYGHVETPSQRVGHLLKLRQLQDESGGLQCIVPLPFNPVGTALAAERHLPGPTALDDLRMVAAARLLLDNVPHVKTFWIMHGLKLSQVALDFGADDIDGTVVWYDITKPAAGATHQETSVGQLCRLIRETGRVPVERDSLYRPVVCPCSA